VTVSSSRFSTQSEQNLLQILHDSPWRTEMRSFYAVPRRIIVFSDRPVSLCGACPLARITDDQGEEKLRENCNRAILLQLMGEYSAAREQYQQVIEEQTEQFGASHTETLMVRPPLF
jgi:hypothetical protein